MPLLRQYMALKSRLKAAPLYDINFDNALVFASFTAKSGPSDLF